MSFCQGDSKPKGGWNAPKSISFFNYQSMFSTEPFFITKGGAAGPRAKNLNFCKSNRLCYVRHRELFCGRGKRR